MNGAKIGMGREGFPLLKEGNAGLHVFCDGEIVALNGEDERLICFHLYWGSVGDYYPYGSMKILFRWLHYMLQFD